MTLFTETLPPADQPYAVPDNWVWVKLGEIVQINPPKHKPNISEEELCSFVPMSAVSEKSGSISVIEEQPYQKVKNGYTGFQEHDVLFAKITPCMENGKAAIARNLKHGFGFGSTEFFVLRCSQRILNQFLYYFVRSKSFRDEAQPNMTGSVGQKRVPRQFLSDYYFPLPPLPEQRRIAAKLDALLGKLREARALIDEARESFALRRAAILHKAFSGKLTAQWRAEHPDITARSGGLFDEEIKETPYQIPDTWKWVKFKEISVNFDGKRIPLKQNDRAVKEKIYPYYGATGIIDQVDNYLFDGTFLLIGEDGANLLSRAKDNAFMATGKFWVNNHAHIVKTTERMLMDYVRNYINSMDLRPFVTGSAQPKLTQANLNKIPIPFAPFEEQREIVRQLDSLLGHESDAAALLDMDDELDLLEQSILSRAFRGELGTNDPAEPPAI